MYYECLASSSIFKFSKYIFLSTKTQTVVMFGHTGNVSFWG